MHRRDKYSQHSSISWPVAAKNIPMIFQDLSLMYTVAIHSENVQYFILFYFYSKFKITTAAVSQRLFKKIFFRTTISYTHYHLREKRLEFVNTIHIHE